MEQEIIELILRNVRVVGWEIIGCSECPFSSPSLDGFGHEDINIADPDEGYYNCALLDKKKIWGENPVCQDSDWVGYFRKVILNETGE